MYAAIGGDSENDATSVDSKNAGKAGDNPKRGLSIQVGQRFDSVLGSHSSSGNVCPSKTTST